MRDLLMAKVFRIKIWYDNLNLNKSNLILLWKYIDNIDYKLQPTFMLYLLSCICRRCNLPLLALMSVWWLIVWLKLTKKALMSLIFCWQSSYDLKNPRPSLWKLQSLSQKAYNFPISWVWIYISFAHNFPMIQLTIEHTFDCI